MDESKIFKDNETKSSYVHKFKSTHR